MIEILRIECSDIEECVMLWKKLIDYHNAINANISVNNNWKELKYKEFENILNLKTRSVFVARVFGVIAGYISISIKELSDLYNRNKIGYIDEIYVEQDFRSRGVGSRLLDEAKYWFQSKEINKVWLNVIPSNVMGQDFWETNCFKTVGVRKEISI